MNVSSWQTYLLGKPEARSENPFGPETDVFKVEGKMFATLSAKNGWHQINLKCDPDEATALCDIFKGIVPGYHMNKRHWITVVLDGRIPEAEVERLIDNSYALVVMGLSKSKRAALMATLQMNSL
jgi:predicted DNA-binding protein (MmcQ/YjbR family)